MNHHGPYLRGQLQQRLSNATPCRGVKRQKNIETWQDSSGTTHDRTTLNIFQGWKNRRLLQLKLQDFQDLAFSALRFDYISWGAQSCRMLLAFVRMRMPYDACCPDFVCSAVEKCKQPNMFDHFVLELSRAQTVDFKVLQKANEINTWSVCPAAFRNLVELGFV